MPIVVVGMADGKVTMNREDVLTTYALGSCVAVLVHDALAGTGGLLHLMLPDSALDVQTAAVKPWMFADSGTRALFAEMRRLGADLKRCSIWLAGGSEAASHVELCSIGKRNCLAVRKVLWQEGLIVRGEEVGGTVSRTVRLDVATGNIWIKTGSMSLNSCDGEMQWRLMS